MAAVRGQRPRAAFGSGLLFGLAFFTPHLAWLGNLGTLPWLLLSVVQAALWGLFTMVLPALARLRAWPLWVAAWWVTAEAVRGRVPLGGFPWGRLAFSQQDSPALGWASVGGAPAVGFVVALAAACLAALLVSPRRTWRRTAPALLFSLVAGAAGQLLLPTAQGGGEEAHVAVVQGNVPRARSTAEQARVERVTANHVAATRELAAAVRAGEAPRPDLVLWPENSTDRDPRNDPALRAQISDVVDELGAPVAVGAILDAPGGRIRNTTLLWRPETGPGPYYAKQHLVPFGEYIPFRSLFGGVGNLQLIPRDFIPGTGPVRLDAGPVRLASSICYEVAYDSQVRNSVHTGANIIAVPTNNATYMRDGSVAQPEQQLAMSRLRAVEHNRSVLIASTSGISAVVSPDGTVTRRSGAWEQAVLTAQVPLRTETTLATRWGQAPEIALAALTLTGLGLAARRAVRGKTGD